MKKIKLGTSNLMVSEIGLGCMRMADKTVDEAKAVIKASLQNGINFFDHADIYGKGKSEEIFAQAIKELGIKREDIIIQSKCGIDNGTFNFSKDHILKAVDGILERLNTDYLDVLLLHRPDALVEPNEVNDAFRILHASGKVRWFGVSNQSAYQMELLQSGVDYPLIANQVQFSLKHTNLIDHGFNVNMNHESGIYRGAGIIEYARLNHQTLQAWSPFYSGYFESIFIDNDEFIELNMCLEKMAKKYDVSKEAIAVAWILRHPAQIQVLVGSMTPSRINKIAKAGTFKLSHNEWYELYKAAGNKLP
ncbi:aldo/keto reductase family oxidoreductase [Erysipelothrix urinaevulpis]|uniref:aldo/keto reductase n=1 Tax=Erysipelothrix urinaevulpis TaxID=2683717 RepID=UPI00135C1EB5|nr:aldo/keto reductase [Erysipelothrix urinaevulpis]